MKLTEEIQKQMFEHYLSTGETMAAIGNKFGLSANGVSVIISKMLGKRKSVETKNTDHPKSVYAKIGGNVKNDLYNKSSDYVSKVSTTALFRRRSSE